jgi:hypothetical protein
MYVYIYVYIWDQDRSNIMAHRESDFSQDDLWARHVRASKMMVYKARQGLRNGRVWENMGF